MGAIPRSWQKRAFVAASLGVLAWVLIAALLPGSDMPTRIWVLNRAGPDEVRIGHPTGPEFTGCRKISSWSGPDRSIVGVCYRRSSLARTQKLALVRAGILPRYRDFGAGYEVTGQTAIVDGETWQEFELFEEEFFYRQYGWWRW